MKTLAELNKELDQLGLDQVERHTIIQSHIKQGLVLSPKKPVAVKKKKKTLKQIIAELNKETRSKNQS
jgi:hypothetical protein